MRTYAWTDLAAIIFELKLNKVAVIATDTVMGLISLKPGPIYDVKNRSLRKKLIRFVSDVNQIGDHLPEDLQKLLAHFWPGGLTIIYKKQGYRMPKCPQLLHLIDQIGPLYSSSANLSGLLPITSFQELINQIPTKINKLIFIDGVVNNPELSTIASTIYDYDRKAILRQGNISYHELADYVTVKKILKLS